MLNAVKDAHFALRLLTDFERELQLERRRRSSLMGKNAQLDNLVGSLDQLVYASFVVAYILDGNLLGLVVRCIGIQQRVVAW